MKIIELESIDSTNEYCKQNDTGEDIAVLAARQTAGKGTKGRSFDSGKGGVYLTVMRHYADFKAEDAFKIMVGACVAVCRTLEKYGVKPVIRWANDVMANGRKISGTLIENTFSGDNISRSIIGIGVNVANTFPDELRDIAISVRECTGEEHAAKEFAADLICELGKEFTVGDYKRYINWFGNAVTLRTADGERSVKALDVDETGRLVVEDNGEIKRISAAEVGLRL